MQKVWPCGTRVAAVVSRSVDEAGCQAGEEPSAMLADMREVVLMTVMGRSCRDSELPGPTVTIQRSSGDQLAARPGPRVRNAPESTESRSVCSSEPSGPVA